MPKKQKQRIKASAGTGGSITPSGNVLVNYGDKQSFSITPDTDHYITDVLVDGVSVGTVSTYIFTNVTVNHSIDAFFALSTYTITALISVGGSINPPGAVVVNYGDDKSFSIIPDTDYFIVDVLVDGISVGAVGSYTFTGVTADHTIEVSFALNTYTITASAGTEGSIAPSGNVVVNYGTDQEFTITPDTGYHIVDVVMDGVSVGAVGSYIFNNVTGDHTIEVSFAIDTYMIIASAVDGGSITPSGAVVVNYCAEQGFTITPNTDYHIVDVVVDGTSVGPIGSYTFTSVVENHRIDVVFSSSWSLMTSGTSNHLWGVWGSSANEVFTVGHFGTILHYDGSIWSPMASGTLNHLTAVWGSSASDVFAVGWNGTILHYDGSIWSPMASGISKHLRAVWGISANDVFTVGDFGTILHYDGSIWSPMVSNTLDYLPGVWGNSASDVFAVGINGTILHYDGSIWSPMVSGTLNHLRSVWGTSANDVFTVGDSGTILHYDGSIWSPMVSGISKHLRAVLGISTNEVFTVGDFGTILHYDGSTWSPMVNNTLDYLSAVWGSSANDVFAVGWNGTILHCNDIYKYIITATSNTGGSITPSGTVKVDYGTDQTFTIAPQICYHIVDVLADGISVGIINSYTFTRVITNHVIEAHFAITKYTITASAITGGSINPSGNVVVNCADEMGFSITPDIGYGIINVLVDSISRGAIDFYKFTGIFDDHTIEALFAPKTYTITVSTSGGGTISPSGIVVVGYRANQTFNIVPDDYFHIVNVVVDGTSVGRVSSYTFSNIDENHEIQAIFRTDIFYIANRFSKEIHRGDCNWVLKMAAHNRVPCYNWFKLMDLIMNNSYNGCFYCLPRYDADTLTTQQVHDNLLEDEEKGIPKREEEWP